MHAFVAISRFFGYLALRLYTHGPLPESAFHSSLGGERTAGSAEYRRIYRIGQIVGWVLVAIGVALLALLVRWIFSIL
jgi:hypothetical protein